jgi:DNA-binding SARP family transcriptional activator/ABC-type branched-subunit amino acid transport system substrate-binding protein
MDFRLLGPLEVFDGDRAVSLGEGRQRSVLVLLLLHHDEVVTTDRLVDALWGEHPPRTAVKVVQNNIAQLRRALGDGDTVVLRTHGRGYALCLGDGSLDVERFEALVREGGAALARKNPGQARDRLGEALSLWRGPALADVAYESFAQPDIARLEERRLAALEQRVDADLELGGHEDLVPELEGLVAEHPAREQFSAQLMLALYRAGRQSDALQVYRDARRTLVDELGVEPGPRLRELEAAILRQDDELAPVATPWPGMPRRRGERGIALLVAGGALLMFAAIGAVVLSTGGGGGSAIPAGAEVLALDPGSGRVTARIAAGRTPTAMAIGGGHVWMVDAEARTLLTIDLSSRAVQAWATGATPVDVRLGGGRVWVANGTPRAGAIALGPVVSEIVGLDPATQRQQATVSLSTAGSDIGSSRPDALAVTADAVWAVRADGSVARIDPVSAVITASTHGLRATAVGAAGAGVWALDYDGRLVQLDERTARVRRHVRLPAAVDAIAVGDTTVWATAWAESKLWRVGGQGRGVPGAVEVGAGVTDIAPTRTGVWLANPIAGTVTRVDPRTMRVVSVFPVGGSPRSLAVDGAHVWIATAGRATAARPDVAGVKPLAASICEPVVAGNGGQADLLMVSDLPLQGDARLAAMQMEQAITFDLREHGFRAGRFRVAYQSCDDALAGTGQYDDSKCAANGRAYAAAADVIAVIGTLNSGCAYSVIPELNRARGGPLAMISPLNSDVGLTRGGTDPGAATVLGTLYPTGVRNYVRIYPAEDLQGAALAELARDRGRRRVFVLQDGSSGYGAVVADGFARVARRLGLTVVGRLRWRSTARSYAALARRVATARAQAVLVSGLLNNNAGRLVRDLRARLGAAVDLMVPDGLGPPSALPRAAGPAARDVFMTVGGVVTDRLPPPGARFAQRFARTQPGADVELFAIYAAQAADVLLQAIARSDGTRRSVLNQLMRTRMRNTLIGDISFDARGDIRQGAETIVRLAGGRVGTNIASIDGAVVERVARLSPRLVDGGG